MGHAYRSQIQKTISIMISDCYDDDSEIVTMLGKPG